MSTSDENFKTYSEILKNNGIKDLVKDVTVKTPELAGDQFVSQCKLVTVSFVDESIVPIELFVKLTVNNPQYASLIKELDMFEKEVRFFNLLLPDLKNFAENKPGYDGFLDRILPKCYFASDTCVVFENATVKGYSILDKKVPHDFDIARQVVKNLAKIHAITLAYIQHLGTEEFEKKYDFLTRMNKWSEDAETLNGPWTQVPINGAIKILGEKPTPGSEKALEYLLKYKDTGFLHCCKLYKRDDQRCPDVVIHSDLWNGNVMFQRNPDTNKPENPLIIDMQTVIIGTPALDLQHYLFVATGPEVIRSSWKKLLKIYYEDVTEIVGILGQKVNYSFEDLESDFRAKCTQGFFYSLFAAYAFDVLDDVEDLANAEGDVSDRFVTQMNSALTKLMEPKGKQFSEKIVRIFEIYQDVRAGIERPE